jgi:small basic protein (TIGR04137 family)
MSIHRSLVLREKLRRHRNVLTRSERLQRLIEDGKFEDKSSVFGLPKLRNILIRAKKVKKETAETPAEGAALTTAAAPGATTSVAGIKPAAGAKTVAAAAPGTKPAAGATAPGAKPAAAGAKDKTASHKADKK